MIPGNGASCLGCGGPLERDASTLRCPRCGTGIRLEGPSAPASSGRPRPSTFLSAFLFVLGGLAGLGLFVLGIAGFSFRRMYAELGASPGGAVSVVANLPFVLGTLVIALASWGFARAVRGRAGGLPMQVAVLVFSGVSMLGCLLALYLPIFGLAAELNAG